MPRFRVIYNPTCSKGKGQDLIPEVEKEMKELGLDYDLVLTEYPWHAADLAKAAAEEGIEVVIAAGGDGTSNEVINGLMLAKKAGIDPLPIMGVLPIGRGNDFNFGAGNTDDWKESCALFAKGTTRKVDIGLVIGGKYPEGRYFGNQIGVGFDTVVGFIATEQSIQGFLGYLVAAIRTTFLYHPAPVLEVQHDGTSFTQPMLMISTMNGKRAGGGFMVGPDSDPTDGVFDVCVADDLPKIKIFPLLIKFMQGTQVGDPAVRYIRTRKLSIKAIEGVIPAHVDGETLCTDGDELSIELFPESLTLLAADGRTA